jgi:O-antigen ligase
VAGGRGAWTVATDAGPARGPLADGWQPLSLDVHATLAAWLKGLAYAGVLVLVLALVENRRRLRTLATTLILAAVFQGMLASVQVLSGWEFLFVEHKGVAHGTFVNRNHLAGFLEMSLALGIGLLIASMTEGGVRRNWRQRLRAWARLLLGPKARLRIYLAVMVITLVLTHSRMGNSAFFASMLVTGLLALLLFRNSPRPVVVLIVSLVVIDTFIVGAWFGIEKVKQRLEETQLSSETRDEVDIYAWDLWGDFRLTGSGAGTFAAVFPRYRQPDVGINFYDHAHNDYLEILTESGLVGALPLGGSVFLSLGAALLAMRRRRDPLLRGMAFSAVMGLMALLIHSSVDFNLQIPANAALFMVLMGLPWLALTLGRRRSGAVLNRQD